MLGLGMYQSWSRTVATLCVVNGMVSALGQVAVPSGMNRGFFVQTWDVPTGVAGDWDTVAEIEAAKTDSSLQERIHTSLNFHVAAADIDYNFHPADNYFYAETDGVLITEYAGSWCFRLYTDDTGELSIDNTVLINNDGNNAYPYYEDGCVILTAGQHEMTVKYGEYEGQAHWNLQWRYAGTDAGGISLASFHTLTDDNVFYRTAATSRTCPDPNPLSDAECAMLTGYATYTAPNGETICWQTGPDPTADTNAVTTPTNAFTSCSEVGGYPLSWRTDAERDAVEALLRDGIGGGVTRRATLALEYDTAGAVDAWVWKDGSLESGLGEATESSVILGISLTRDGTTGPDGQLYNLAIGEVTQGGSGIAGSSFHHTTNYLGSHETVIYCMRKYSCPNGQTLNANGACTGSTDSGCGVQAYVSSAAAMASWADKSGNFDFPFQEYLQAGDASNAAAEAHLDALLTATFGESAVFGQIGVASSFRLDMPDFVDATDVKPEKVRGACWRLNDCNGNGVCDAETKRCTCHPGFGAETDIATYKAPDCSTRTCPSGSAFVDLPSAPKVAHAQAECSNAGLCDRTSGRCKCFTGYTGAACERTTCPNDCSGHGRCVSMRSAAYSREAFPIRQPTVYGDLDSSENWDADRMFGCICDSEWEVGLGSGQRQVATWFGADCSLRHCPSGNDPNTERGLDCTDLEKDEENCSYRLDNGGTWMGATDGNGDPCFDDPTGAATCTTPSAYGSAAEFAAAAGIDYGAVGNKCHVECSGRGTCDHSTGTCTCFESYHGGACELRH